MRRFKKIYYLTIAINIAIGYVLTGDTLQPSEDYIWFINGDRLRGEIKSIDPIKGVEIRNKYIQNIAVFPLETIVKISFGDRQNPLFSPKNACKVKLINLDEIEGDLISLDEREMILETAFSGKISIPRKRIDSFIPIVPKPTVVFEGPTGIEGWTVSNSPAPGAQPSTWKYRNGALITTESGSIARDLKLPDITTIEFDIAWQNYLSIAIALYANTLFPIQLAQKDDGPDFGPFYSLQINFNTVNLMAIRKGAPLNSMGIGFLPLIDRKTSAHVMIRVNKPEKTIYLFVDGLLVKQWQDPGQFSGSGTYVRFVNQVAAPLKISNIVVSHWDGRTEISTNKVDNSRGDFVRLLNNDTVIGTAKEFKDGKFIVQTAFGNVDVPFTRINQFYFSIIGREPIFKKPDNITATLIRGGKLTIKIERWENDKLIATNPVFGTVKIPLWALRMLIFKPENQITNF